MGHVIGRLLVQAVLSARRYYELVKMGGGGLSNNRAAVEAELGTAIEDHVWDLLEKNGDADDLDFGLATLREVAAKARGVRASLRLDAEPQPVVREPGFLQAGEAARARGDALSSIYAAWASARPDVRRFREKVLARSLQIMAGIAGRAAHASGETAMMEHDQVAEWVSWLYDADAPGRNGHQYVFKLITETKAHGPKRVVDLRYVDGQQERILTVGATRMLGQLAELADKLAGEYRWWPPEATMFILTGQTPNVVVYLGSAEIRYHEVSATSRVIMTLDPSLTPGEVAGIYGRLRKRFHPESLPRYQSALRYRLAGHVGPHVQMRLDDPHSRTGPGRPPKPGPTGLAIFVEPLPGYTWQQLRHTWNQLYSDWADGNGRPYRYESASNFTRDAKTSINQLLFPGWTSLGSMEP
jgi:hypothetical protein